MASAKNAASQLVELFEKAIKASDKAEEELGEVEEKRCTEALKAMGAINVTTTILMDTQIGKRLRKLTKHSSSKICVAALELMDSWKKIVSSEATAKNGSAPTAVRKVSVKERPKSPGLESPPIISPTSSVKVKRAVKTETTVEVKTTVTSTDRSVPFVPPKLANIHRCGDPTRDRIRELLVESFAKVGIEAESNQEHKDLCKGFDVLKAAVTVESIMFKKLGLSSNMANKSKYRSIMFNLKDANNPDLRRRVLIGEIAPEALLTMSAEDMASDQRKHENNTIKAKALFECERGLKASASTDQFKCSKCLQRQCTYFQMQTRSADEPMTTFVTCVNCNNHWKFC